MNRISEWMRLATRPDVMKRAARAAAVVGLILVAINHGGEILTVRPSQCKAETQPQLHPALLRLSAMVSQYFTTDSPFSACQLAMFSGKLPSMEPEIDCKLQSNSR